MDLWADWRRTFYRDYLYSYFYILSRFIDIILDLILYNREINSKDYNYSWINNL